jgi:hypothetical protein
MAHITPPPLPPRTVLERIARRFKDVADDFYDLYDKLKDVWLLGKWLRWPFWWLYFYFNFIADKFYDADDLLREFKRWIDGLIEGSVFEDLLDWLSYHYRSIRNDPKRWVRVQFQGISHDLWRLINPPHVWIFEKIQEWITWFYEFRTDPKGTVVKWLTEKYPWLSQFLFNALAFIVNNVYAGIGFLRELRDNPTNRVVQWLANWYSWITSFLSDPFGFIIEKVKQFSIEVRLFFDNPVQWARDKIKQVLGMNDYDLSDIPYYILKSLLNKAMMYVNREYPQIRQVACDIIMRFM